VLALASVLGGAASGMPGTGVEQTSAAPPSGPAAAPDNSIALVPFVSSGLSQPLFITHAGDGTGRLFVLQKGGLVRLIVSGQLQAAPYLSLTVDGAGERGLLAMAFHPSFETNGRFYVWYTFGGNNNLAEFQVSGDPRTSLSLAPSARSPLLQVAHSGATNHNGGTLAFGPDGMLYLSIGENATPSNAQDLTNLLGKVIRIDVNVSGPTYSIPPDNPFVLTPGARPEIWALGFRNPWRASFDRLTGDLFVGDVGSSIREEINLVQRGQNFGWPTCEGSCGNPNFVNPILDYAHNNDFGLAVTGGYRYRGPGNPDLLGLYFFGDFTTGRIWKGIQSGSTWSFVEALDTDQFIVSFGEDEAGELYVVGFGNGPNNGTISRTVQTAPFPTATPTVTPTPTVTQTSTVTQTPTSTATPLPTACSPRPRVLVQTASPGPGLLDVNVRATDNGPGLANHLQSLAFTRIDNALVAVGNQPESRSAFTVPLPNGTESARFIVRRDQPGRPMRVDLTIIDRCGPWPTFVGGGTGLP
jgi:hypothetical protein